MEKYIPARRCTYSEVEHAGREAENPLAVQREIPHKFSDGRLDSLPNLQPGNAEVDSTSKFMKAYANSAAKREDCIANYERPVCRELMDRTVRQRGVGGAVGDLVTKVGRLVEKLGGIIICP